MENTMEITIKTLVSESENEYAEGLLKEFRKFLKYLDNIMWEDGKPTKYFELLKKYRDREIDLFSDIYDILDAVRCGIGGIDGKI